MLQFVLGDVLSNKIEWVVQNIQKTRQDNPSKKNYVIVPEHIKFDAELVILKRLGALDENESIAGSIHTQVFSFSRLAWYFLKETGKISDKPITQSGSQMLLRYVIKQNEEQLRVFRGEVNKAGFINKLNDLFNELRQGNVYAQTFDEIAHHWIERMQDNQASSDRLLNNEAEKLEELALLYNAYIQALVGQYIDREDIYHELSEFFMATAVLEDSDVYIVDFDHLTAREWAVVKAILLNAENSYITFQLKKKPRKHINNAEIISAMLYERFNRFAKDQQLKVLSEVIVTEGDERYSESIKQLLNQFEQQFVNSTNKTEIAEESRDENNQTTTEQNTVYTQRFASKQAESQWVVRRIYDLIATGEYRFKDIAIYTRKESEYRLILEPLLRESNIPYFLDEQDSIAHHPLVEWLASVFAIDKNNWRYTDIMRYLRTGLNGHLLEAEIDWFENQLLATGYQGRRFWANDKKWHVSDGIDSENAQRTHELRQKIAQPLLTFYERLQTAQTMKEAIYALYTFVLEQKVDDTLKQWRDTFDQNLEKAKQQEQTWSTFIDLLDQFVLILGNEPFDNATFFQVLISGFDGASYSLAPVTLDAVLISGIDTRKVAPRKIVFAIGLDRGTFPQVYDNTSLLTSSERMGLSKLLPEFSYLAIDEKFRTIGEPAVAMRLFASATDALYFSYAGSSEDVSLYFKWIEQIAAPVPEVIGSPRQIIREVMSALRDSYDTRTPLSNKHKQLLRQIMNSSPGNRVIEETVAEEDVVLDWRADFETISGSFTYTNQPTTLTNAKQLYQSHLALSVSRIERFYKDPFGYFLTSGLRLKERDIAQVTAATVGNVYHGILDYFFKEIVIHGLTLEQLSPKLVDELFEKATHRYFDSLSYNVFELNDSLAFAKNMLVKQTRDYANVWVTMRQYFNFNPVATEVRFSGDKQSDIFIQPLQLDDRKLYINGIIDRVDTVTLTDGRQFTNIIDYKSSQRKLEWEKVRAGYSLQLLMYLYAIKNNQSNVFELTDPTMGAYYYALKPTETELPRGDEKVALKDLLNGISPVDSQLTGLITLDATDTKLLTSHSDDIDKLWQMKFVKSGSYTAGTAENAVNPSQFNYLMAYLEKKIVAAGNKILSGYISMRPYKDDPYVPSKSSHRLVSLFDATMPDNRYQTIDSMKKDQFFNEIEQELQGDSDE